MATTVDAVILDYGEVLSLPQSTPGKQELYKLSGLEDRNSSRSTGNTALNMTEDSSMGTAIGTRH